MSRQQWINKRVKQLERRGIEAAEAELLARVELEMREEEDDE